MVTRQRLLVSCPLDDSFVTLLCPRSCSSGHFSALLIVVVLAGKARKDVYINLRDLYWTPFALASAEIGTLCIYAK